MADDRFYVKTLRMQNFRCFEDVTLGPFDPHFNLLVGENGAGKSSVLVALAQSFVHQISQSTTNENRELIGHEDIRITYRETEDGWEGPTKHPPCEIELLSSFRGVEKIRRNVISSFEVETYYLGGAPKKLFNEGDVAPAIIFYRASRRFQVRAATTDEAIFDTNPRLEGYANWSMAGQEYGPLREWLKEQTLLALQGEQRKKEARAALAGVRAQRQLLLLNKAIVDALDGAIGVEYDAEVSDIVFRMVSNDRRRFSEVSDGQRAILGLLADMVRRICCLNHERLGAAALIDTPGLVLIDEIDLHLHPKWQRRIVPALKEIFPKIQFFATTHSPQVIGEARPEEIVLLTKDGQQRRPSGAYGRDSNWILECVMEAEGRDPTIAGQLKTLFQLIEDDNFDEAREAIKALRRDIGDGPETVGAEAYLWRMEHLGEEAAE